MPFSATFETRHTDTYAATPFVHQGVLLAFTEMTYARMEAHLDLNKPEHIVCVQRESVSKFNRPLHWRENARVEVVTVDVSAQGFTQAFQVFSAASGTLIATFTHRWAWMDTIEGRRLDLSPEVQEAYRSV
jgi:acyl-CoA thioesterase FadM